MRKFLLPGLFVILLGTALVGLVYGVSWASAPGLADYERVRVGMSVDDVQALLGRGTPVSSADVPCHVVILRSDGTVGRELPRPDDGGPHQRVKPVALRPVVEGDYILRWGSESAGGWVLVAFRDGKVTGKDFWTPNDR